MRINSMLAVALLGPFACAVQAGCSANSSSDYQLSQTSAQDALETALSAWSKGISPTGADAVAQPAIQFGDFEHAAGKRLKGFQILSEQPEQDGSARAFRVRLEIEGQAPKEVDYYVVGIDPLWIFRDRDYQQASMQ